MGANAMGATAASLRSSGSSFTIASATRSAVGARQEEAAGTDSSFRVQGVGAGTTREDVECSNSWLLCVQRLAYV